MLPPFVFFFFFFFNDTATTEIYTLSLHDALPISSLQRGKRHRITMADFTHAAEREMKKSTLMAADHLQEPDRKSTRLNSSHDQISYAVFCLKKKKKKTKPNNTTTNQKTTQHH